MNRRDDIIKTAIQLFTQQGYHTTSIRQIAVGVGCRESSIYVHFKKGKRELLQTILKHHMPDFGELLSECVAETASENDFDQLGQILASLAETHLQDWQWIAGEFPILEASERAIVHAKLVDLHQVLVDCLEAHSSTGAETQSLAWMLIVMLSGYAQLHRIFKPDFTIDLSRNHFVKVFKVLLAGTPCLSEQANAQ
jgi:AcrR family transcriptional regulator